MASIQNFFLRAMQLEAAFDQASAEMARAEGVGGKFSAGEVDKPDVRL